MDERLRLDKLKKYIKKKYYKNNNKIITIKVNSEKELYNSLDKSHDTLSRDITDYLERTVETLIPLNKIEIQIESDKKIDLNNFKKCLQVHYGIETLNSDRIEKLVKRKEIFLLIVAVISLTTFLFIDKSILYEIRNFIATIAIWEFIDMKLYTDESNEIKRFIYELLDDAELSYKSTL